MKIYLFCAWLVAFVASLNISLELISSRSSFGCVVGFFLLVSIIYFSIKTKCLTQCNFKKHS